MECFVILAGQHTTDAQSTRPDERRRRNCAFRAKYTQEQQGKRDAAEAAYREAIRIQPDFDAARDHLDNLPAALGKMDEARYHRARQIRRESPDTEPRP